VRITNKPFSATQAMYAVTQFMDMLKSGVPVPPTILVKAMMDAGMIDQGAAKEWLATLGPAPLQATQATGSAPAPPGGEPGAGGSQSTGADQTQQAGG
jgi:hypothetical protein